MAAKYPFRLATPAPGGFAGGGGGVGGAGGFGGGGAGGTGGGVADHRVRQDLKSLGDLTTRIGSGPGMVGGDVTFEQSAVPPNSAPGGQPRGQAGKPGQNQPGQAKSKSIRPAVNPFVDNSLGRNNSAVVGNSPPGGAKDTIDLSIPQTPGRRHPDHAVQCRRRRPAGEGAPR